MLHVRACCVKSFDYHILNWHHATIELSLDELRRYEQERSIIEFAAGEAIQVFVVVHALVGSTSTARYLLRHCHVR